MKHFTLSLIFSVLSAAASAAGAPAGRDYAFGMDDGCDSMRVRIAFHSPASGLMEIYPELTNDVIRAKMWPVGQRDDHVWGISQGKAKGKVDVYPDCGLRLDVSTKLKKTYIGFFKVWWGYDFVYWFMPFFDKSHGLYDHKQVTAGLKRWKRDYAPFAEREVEFDFQYDASRNRTSVWMDRQFAGRLAYSGKIRKVTLSLKAKAPAKEGDEERGGNVAEFVLDREWSQPVSDVIEEECKFMYRPNKVKKLDPRDFDEIGVWVKGDGSFGRVLLEIHTSQGLIRVNGFPDRAFVCFDGWRLLRAKMPKIRPDKSGKTWFDPAAFYFTTYRKALNPRDMVPVDTNLRVGDIVGIRTGAPLPAAPKEKAYDAMDYVGEKDL